MALFRKKRGRVLDLTERYKKQLDAETQKSAMESAPVENSGSAFGFLGSMASAGLNTSEDRDFVDLSSSANSEKKQKLAKRLMDMTSKLEDMSNQIYHLQQRIEVLERKTGVGVE